MKSIDIHGKAYVPVHERVKYFHEHYKNWYINTEILEVSDQHCVIKALVYDDKGILRSTGHAYERAIGKVNETSHVENGECVPINTQILTKRGFLFYHELKRDDECLTLNPDTLAPEWQKPLSALTIYQNVPVVKLENSRFKAVCTKNHKWICKSGLKPLNEFAENEVFKVSAKPFIPDKLNDDASKLAWFFSDAAITYTKDGLPSRCQVSQSKAKNFDALNALFGNGKVQKKYNKNWKTPCKWSVPAEEVRRILGKFKVRTYKDLPVAVCNMGRDEAFSFYEAMMCADGDGRRFAKTYKEVVEAMQIACAIIGLKTGIIKKRTAKNATKPIYILPIHKTNNIYFSEIKTTMLPPTTVWCPTLKNGTWFAKQGGQVWATGNTSSVGRALGLLGIGIEDAFASSNEVVSAQKQQSAPLVERTCTTCGVIFKTKYEFASQCLKCYKSNNNSAKNAKTS